MFDIFKFILLFVFFLLVLSAEQRLETDRYGTVQVCIHTVCRRGAFRPCEVMHSPRCGEEETEAVQLQEDTRIPHAVENTGALTFGDSVTATAQDMSGHVVLQTDIRATWYQD